MPLQPPTSVRFNTALSTRPTCIRILDEDAEKAITPLATGAFQLQAAWAGVRIAELSSSSQYTKFLKDIAVDYDGAFSASLNLAVRCSVSVVDLCAAAMGRLAGLTPPSSDYELDATQFMRKWETHSSADDGLRSLGNWLHAQLQSEEWHRMQRLRDKVTHRFFNRHIYGTSDDVGDGQRPLAHPQHIEIKMAKGESIPLDQLTTEFADFAESVWESFCERLADLE